MQNLPGYLPGTVYGFFDKSADVDHQQPDCVLESYLDGKVGLISYANSDHTPISERSIEIALLLNAPEAEWTVREKYYVGKVSGKIKYMGELHDGVLIIGTEQYFDAINAAKDAKTSTAAGSHAASVATLVDPPRTKVVAAITENRWKGDTLVVSGTLTNSSAVAVLVTSIGAKEFNQDQEMVVWGSDFTIDHDELAPGDVVNFKVALKDGTKQVKFVKVLPTWTP
jgi:hypothetical protein